MSRAENTKHKKIKKVMEVGIKEWIKELLPELADQPFSLLLEAKKKKAATSEGKSN